MTQTPTEPKVKWGFFAATPRIVRTNYKQLSHSEKWLYVCLKDICGDTGMCYRSLRALALETDLSTGSLSTGIRHLHEAGLIHAEKKRRSTNPTAKEVWHITIVDIWQENAAYCSKNEHSSQQASQNNVQNLNKGHAQKRSKNEQKRSKFVARRTTLEEQPVKEEQPFVPTAQSPWPSFVRLAPDEGANVVNLTEDEVPLSTEEAEVSHSQWLSESVQEAEEVPAPGGQAPTVCTVQAPAAALKGIQPSHDTPNNATGQARTEHPTKQPTRIIPPVITLPSKDKTDENGKCKKEDKPLLTKTADVRSLINAFRGYALEARGPIINENTIIRELCELHTLDHFTATMGHLRTCQCKKHKWWREGNQGGFKAENLRDLLPDILSELGMIPKPEEPPFVPAVPRAISSYAPWAPHEEVIPRAAVAH